MICRRASAESMGSVARPDHVDRHAVEPGAKRAVAAEPFQAAPRAHEHVLRQIVSVGAAARQHARQRQHRRLMPAHQLVERLAAARRGSLYQLAVGIHCRLDPPRPPIIPQRRRTDRRRRGRNVRRKCDAERNGPAPESKKTTGGFRMTRRIAIAAALILSLGALPLVAQDPGGGTGPGQRRGGPGRGGPGGPMGIFPGLNQVDLTETQREQIRGILEQGRPADDPGAKVRDAEQALHAAVLSEDAQGVTTAKAALTAAQVAELDHRVDLMQKIAQVLTPAQRQQLAQLPPPPGGRGGRGRGGRH
jgi:Spy/CpxP family protein refolding chaperone